jgi:hypothetical protein
MTNVRNFALALLSIPFCLPYDCMGMKRVFEVATSDSFFHALSIESLTKIVARTNNRNALRKTCKLFKGIAGTAARPGLVLHPDFKGSEEDIIKACEHYIEIGDHTNLQAIIERYDANKLNGTNIIGYSLQEYALYLNKGKCLSTLATTDNTLPSLNDRAEYGYPWGKSPEERYNSMTFEPKELKHEQLLNQLHSNMYIHKTTQNTAIITVLIRYLQELDGEPGRIMHAFTFTQSPLNIAAYNNDSPLIKYLLPSQQGNDLAYYGCTPLYVACMRGNPECITLLLAAGWDPNIELSDDGLSGCSAPGKTPLCITAQRGFTECARLLLDSKKLRSKNEQCQLALLYAIYAECTKLVELLLSQKIDLPIPAQTLKIFNRDDTITIKMDDYQPLDIATCYGNAAIVQRLINAGAKVTDVTTEIAENDRDTEIIRILQNARSKIETNTTPSTQPYVSDDEE